MKRRKDGLYPGDAQSLVRELANKNIITINALIEGKWKKKVQASWHMAGFGRGKLFIKWGDRVYLYSIATVTNYCKLGDLKQHKFNLLQFWRSEVSNPSIGGATFLLTVLGKNQFPPFFQLLWAACLPWLEDPFQPATASLWTLRPSAHPISDSPAPFFHL